MRSLVPHSSSSFLLSFSSKLAAFEKLGLKDHSDSLCHSVAVEECDHVTEKTCFAEAMYNAKVQINANRKTGPDPCLGVDFAAKNYGTCCSNGGHKKTGHLPVCQDAKGSLGPVPVIHKASAPSGCIMSTSNNELRVYWNTHPTGTNHNEVKSVAPLIMRARCPVTCNQCSEKSCPGLVKTKAVLDALAPAAYNMGQCDKRVGTAAGYVSRISIGTSALNTLTGKVKQLTDLLLTGIKLINNVSVKGGLMTPSVKSMLGKIPKVGQIIVMVLEIIEVVIRMMNRMATLFDSLTEKLNDAVSMVNNLFGVVKVATSASTTVLKVSHDVLDAAFQCASTENGCSSSAVTKSLEELSGTILDHRMMIDGAGTAGKTCTEMLNPMNAILKMMADIADKIAQALEPISNAIAKVNEFFNSAMEKIRKFVEEIMDNNVAKCFTAVATPMFAVLDMMTCPIDEVVDGVTYLGQKALAAMNNVMVGFINDAVTNVVDAVVPDGLSFTIPDVKFLVPTIQLIPELSVNWCAASAALTVSNTPRLRAIDIVSLPLVITSELIKTMLKNQLSLDRWEPDEYKFGDACKAAIEKMKVRTDLTPCGVGDLYGKLFKPFDDLMTCETTSGRCTTSVECTCPANLVKNELKTTSGGACWVCVQASANSVLLAAMPSA